jgi:hypothetical protein
MNPRYIVASEVFSSSTYYANLDESGYYLHLAEGGTKTLLAAHYDKLKASAEAKHDHSEGKHSEAYGSIWRRVGKDSTLYSLVCPCLPLCDYVPPTSEDLLKQAIRIEQCRLDAAIRTLQAQAANLNKVLPL